MPVAPAATPRAPSAPVRPPPVAAPPATPPATPRVASAPLPVVPPPIGGAAAEAIAAILASEATNADKLEKLRTEVIGECTRCKLHRGRSRLVFGVGNPNAALVFVGEGPGADEDRQGIPFVGKAGQLLTKMIEAMGFRRDDVYICNVVKCRPPSNRDPEPDEVLACEPFLQAQLAILHPLVIVALGRHAAQTLLRSKTPITRLRGGWQEYRGIPLMPTYHPSYLLREETDPSKTRKREAWSDLQEVMKVFGKDRAN
ncbi:MAG: uracil-DNA glycosylase [Deltaproteobacteria bacterium]|nr:uracil-DNA glycosylase [Deltaproteobacteria bacterium]